MSNARPLVVVADDEPDILLLVIATLEGAGYEIAQASDGIVALELVRKLRPAAVVLDIAMPELDGLAVLERVRADPATTDLPVVILSARAQEEDVSNAYVLGASRYVRKPFSPRELVAALDGLLGRQPGLR